MQKKLATTGSLHILEIINTKSTTQKTTMKTLQQIRKDLEANNAFFNSLSATVFNRRASIDEMMKWVKDNTAEFEAFSGVKVGEKKESVVLTRDDAKSVKAHLELYTGKGKVSVRRNGKYKLEVSAVDFSPTDLQGWLNECGYTIKQSLSGKFGAYGVSHNWLLHIVSPL
jgi:hypothetical protein